MNKEYSIEVWDIQFYKMNEEGDALTDNNGNVSARLVEDRSIELGHQIINDLTER